MEVLDTETAECWAELYRLLLQAGLMHWCTCCASTFSGTEVSKDLIFIDFPFCSASYASLLLLWYSYASVCFCDFCCPWIQASIGDTLAAPAAPAAALAAMFPRRKSRKSTVPCHCRYWMRRPRMKFQKMMELLHHLCWNLRSPEEWFFLGILFESVPLVPVSVHQLCVWSDITWVIHSNTLVNFVDFSNLLLHLALFGNACIFWSACYRPDEPGATNSVPANAGPENELQRPFQWHGATGFCKSLQSAMMCQECDHCDNHPWKDAQFEGQQSGSIMTYHELSYEEIQLSSWYLLNFSPCRKDGEELLILETSAELRGDV